MLVDMYMREYPVIEIDVSLDVEWVIVMLKRGDAVRRLFPQITFNNKLELQSEVLNTWAYSCHVQLIYRRLGKSIANTFNKTLNECVRDEIP
jgi:hypothetical protein